MSLALVGLGGPSRGDRRSRVHGQNLPQFFYGSRVSDAGLRIARGVPRGRLFMQAGNKVDNLADTASRIKVSKVTRTQLFKTATEVLGSLKCGFLWSVIRGPHVLRFLVENGRIEGIQCGPRGAAHGHFLLWRRGRGSW